MRTSPFVVDWPMPGKLAIMSRPCGGESLGADLRALREQGADALVCALTAEDLTDLDLVHEPALAIAAGMSYVAFPIEDFGLPDREALIDLAGSLGGELRAGRFVVVHCRGGIGRSGLIACAVLIDCGASADEAMAAVSKARGHDAPETCEQRAMLRAIAR